MSKSTALESIVSPDDETQMAVAVWTAAAAIALLFVLGFVYQVVLLVS